MKVLDENLDITVDVVCKACLKWRCYDPVAQSPGWNPYDEYRRPARWVCATRETEGCPDETSDEGDEG